MLTCFHVGFIELIVMHRHSKASNTNLDKSKAFVFMPAREKDE